MSDGCLAGRYRAGDDQAFTVLHARYAPGLGAHARRMVCPEQAKDAVQDTFLRAHRFLLEDPRAVEVDLSLGGWLHTVVRRRCLDELRRGQRTVDLAGCPEATDGLSSHDLAVQAEELRMLRSALGALPLRQRQALVGAVLDGEPYADVARRMDTSVSAIKSLVNRARLSLRHASVAASG